MARTEAQTLLLMLERQRDAIIGVATQVEALRSFMADGLTIRDLPEIPSTPSAPINVDVPAIDTASIAASVSEGIRSGNASLNEYIKNLESSMSDVVRQLKATELNGGIRAVGSARLRGVNSSGQIQDVRVNDNGQLDVNLADSTGEVKLASLSSVNVGTASATTSGVEVTNSNPMADRRNISIKADPSNSEDVFIVGSQGQDVATGYPLSASEEITLEVDDTVSLWVKTSTGTADVAYIEIGL